MANTRHRYHNAVDVISEEIAALLLSEYPNTTEVDMSNTLDYYLDQLREHVRETTLSELRNTV